MNVRIAGPSWPHERPGLLAMAQALAVGLRVARLPHLHPPAPGGQAYLTAPALGPAGPEPEGGRR